MFRRLVVVPVLVAALCAFLSPPLFGQSKSDGDRLWREGDELREKAQSNEDLKRAVEKYEKALSIFRKFRDRRSEASVLNWLGNIFRNWGQCDKAVNYYERSLAIKREIKDRTGEGVALNNLGLVYSDWGQYDKAK